MHLIFRLIPSVFLVINTFLFHAPLTHSVLPQPVLPAPKSVRSVSPIVPAYLGLWEAREVFVPDAQGHLRVDTSAPDPEWSDNTLLPYGQHIEFTDGYDAKSRVAFLVMYLHPPFASNALQYPILRFHYSEDKGGRKVVQQAIKHEYDLTISKGEAEDYAPVGATADSSITYFLQAGHEWNCEFYVAKDRQRMWTVIGFHIPTPGTAHEYTLKRGFQLYCRLAEYKRHPIKP